MTETAQQIVEYQQGQNANTTAASDRSADDAGAARVRCRQSLELVERALVLQERWEAAQARKAFDAAMAAVRGELPAIVKNRSVSYGGKTGTSYRHEDLAGIASQIDPILAKHGLTYRFRTEANGPALKVTCIISHRDGYSEENSLSAPNGAPAAVKTLSKPLDRRRPICNDTRSRPRSGSPPAMTTTANRTAKAMRRHRKTNRLPLSRLSKSTFSAKP